ncbi:UNVERIFIED_CONTAM: Aberrant root formation protein 4 [Sesamum calycinum]|uniref:Aberrant root formation protein 4 n=1 Tax=Sesamum calycinum TaxID=2727403 RepID=A0AAW2N2F4_9LAMI
MVAASDTMGATLHQTLASCSKSIEAGDYSKSEESIAELVNFLNSISDSLAAGERGNEDPEKIAVEILTQIHQYMASPTVKQEVIDALAFELPKAVARFACVSTKCLEIAEDLVYWFIEKCSPRDMLSILCEEGEDKKKLRALLGLYVLQIMVDNSCEIIWGYKASEVATAAKADLPVVIMELQGDWARRCEAIGMLKYIFSCANLPWELKQHGIRFLLRVMDGIVSYSYDDHVDYSMYMPTLYTSLQVLSALNLYRFILITESSGNSNSTGILSKDKLQKAYNEWLLPLRTLVTGTMAESQKDYENLACDTICALNPVELVLYRCIELVEEKLKQY